jgi:metal-responsive CopG/Arc/MetJ family transcriptional regulator
MQVSITLDETIVNKIDTAKPREVSRSRFIANCIDAYFNDDKNQIRDNQGHRELQTELSDLHNELRLQEEIIRMKEDKIRDLEKSIVEFEAQTRFLRSEYAT